MRIHESAYLTQIHGYLKQWDGYTVIGNKPYAKGCYLIRKGYYQPDGIYIMPKVIVSTTTNWDMLQLLTMPGFNPLKALKMFHELKHTPDGLLNMSDDTIDSVASKMRLIEKAVDLLEEGSALAMIFIDTDNAGIQQLIKELKKAWKIVRSN